MNEAWFTGLFEGEGCIWKDPRSNSIRLTVNSTDKDIIDRLYQMAGCGDIKPIKFPPERAHYKPAWVWYLHKAKEVRRLLVLMLPYFGERRAYQALNALDTLEVDRTRKL
jgi:DNA-binding transcriptional regulator WhiA